MEAVTDSSTLPVHSSPGFRVICFSIAAASTHSMCLYSSSPKSAIALDFLSHGFQTTAIIIHSHYICLINFQLFSCFSVMFVYMQEWHFDENRGFAYRHQEALPFGSRRSSSSHDRILQLHLKNSDKLDPPVHTKILDKSTAPNIQTLKRTRGSYIG